MRKPSRFPFLRLRSVFPQTLEQAAFVAYFLGAVVPLLALAFVVDRYAVPQLLDGPWPYALAALMVSFSGLSLGAFLLLRKVTRNTIRRMDEDNRRLEILLEVSGSLGKTLHQDEAIDAAADCAVKLTGAEAAFVVRKTESDATPVLAGRCGASADSLFEKLGPTLSGPDGLEGMVELALSGRRPVLLGAEPAPGRKTKDAVVAAAVPIVSERNRGALVAAQRVEGAIEGGFSPGRVDALSTLAGLASVALANAELREAQQNFFVHVTDMLIGALDSHMDLQQGHARRVAHFALQLARELGFEEARLQRLHFASLLHDIGMLKISPEKRHSRQVCRQHALLGYRMLNPIQLWEDIAPFVLHHHEWFDGRGYPQGLAAEDIPLESRIIGIAEAFDSMTSQASYKTPVSVEEALRRIGYGASTQFDPDLASRFIELMRGGSDPTGA